MSPVEALCKRFFKFFAVSAKELEVASVSSHRNELLNYNPIKRPAQRIPYAFDELVKKELEVMLERGIIEPSLSPYRFPLFSFATKILSPCEVKYSTTEKECFGIVWATKKFHPFLIGMPFIIRTYHKALTFLKNWGKSENVYFKGCLSK